MLQRLWCNMLGRKSGIGDQSNVVSGLDDFIIGVRHWLRRKLRWMRLIWWGRKLKLLLLRLNHFLLCGLRRMKVLRRKILSGRVRKVPLPRLLWRPSLSRHWNIPHLILIIRNLKMRLRHTCNTWFPWSLRCHCIKCIDSSLIC